jgi:protease IV
MFSRRHPFLFSVLVLAALVTVGTVFLSLMVMAVAGPGKRYRGEAVGVIEIAGAIVDSALVIEQIKEFREEDNIKAIVLRIDSPGGGVGPSQEIYREIRKTSAEKKVIASMGAVAASGGYYVAAACDGIVANPGTITGSIGVIMGYTNIEALLEKIGLSPVVVKSGEFKDIGSPVRPMSEKEKQLLEQLIQTIHRQFVEDIASGRNMEAAQVREVADGRIFTGEEARTFGLVDRLGNLQDAVEWAAELGGIEGKIETVQPEKERLSLLRYFMESALQMLNEWRAGIGISAPQARM